MEVLAYKLKAQLNLKATILIRTLENKQLRRPQASLSNQGRLKGIRSRYHLNKTKEKILNGKRILLLDDVATTGATLQAAAIALIRSGAASIDILTLCRSPTWSVRSSRNADI